MAALNIVGALVLVAAFMFFALRRVPRYLHFLQQDDYDNRRFRVWLFDAFAFDHRVSLALLVVAFLPVAFHWMPGLSLPLAIVFVVAALREPDPRKEAKKKLVITARANRILLLTLALAFPIACFAYLSGALVWVLAVQSLPVLLLLANILLAPVEARIQQRFWDEAHARLLKVNPTVIGITGSFGKTSLKHILGHVLEMNASTLYTPGSVNTPMGVSRIIRENLRDDTRYFLAEMGAYGIHSIQRLCNLTPPGMGIITALGEAHYERFKTLDAVARAKFELAEAVCATPSGKMAVHESVLAQPYAEHFVKTHSDRFVVYGASEGAQIRITSVEQTTTGLDVSVVYGGQTYQLTAPLFGRQHGDNIAGAFTVAMSLGIAPDRFISALRTVPQITHRLEVKRQPDGRIYIDDAYNSNPQGFTAAMELVSFLAGGAKRRILITPGVVELGDHNDSVHAELGEKAAKLIDIAVVVRGDRFPTFAEAYKKAGGKEIHEFPSLTEARAWLTANTRAGDIILFENDLPDLLERKLKL